MKTSKSILISTIIIIIIGFAACQKPRKQPEEIEVNVSGPIVLAVDEEYYGFDTIYKYLVHIKCNSDSFFMPIMNDSFKIKPGSETWLKVINGSIMPSGGINDFLSLKNYKMKIGEAQTFYFTSNFLPLNSDTAMFGFFYYSDTTINPKSFLIVCDLENDTIKSTVRVEFFNR